MAEQGAKWSEGWGGYWLSGECEIVFFVEGNKKLFPFGVFESDEFDGERIDELV